MWRSARTSQWPGYWRAARRRAPRHPRDVDGSNCPGCGEHEGVRWAEEQSKDNDRRVLHGWRSRRCAARTGRIACDRCEGETGSKSGVPCAGNTRMWPPTLVRHVSFARSCVYRSGGRWVPHTRRMRRRVRRVKFEAPSERSAQDGARKNSNAPQFCYPLISSATLILLRACNRGHYMS